MTEEPAEDADEEQSGPTEADVEAAQEDLEAVGAPGEGDSEDPGTDADDRGDSDEARDGSSGAADRSGDGSVASETPDESGAPEAGDEAESETGTSGGDEESGADESDGTAAEVANPEDLIEDPAERRVAGTEPSEAVTEGGAAAAVEQAEPADVDEEPAGGDGEPGTATEAGADAAETASDVDGGAAADDAADAGDDEDAGEAAADAGDQDHQPGVPADVRTYDRFTKVDGAQYDRVNDFLRERTYVTAREWAIARLCSDFRTETGVEMTKIGENLPELVPFMTDTYTAQAVNQARSSFEEKVRQAGATFLYGAMCDFFTAEELDDVMYEATEVAKFLLEVEGVELSVEEELEAEDRISAVMREVRESSAELRHEECPECGARLTGDD